MPAPRALIYNMYIYIYIERERERDIHNIYIYIYVFYIYFIMSRSRDQKQAVREKNENTSLAVGWDLPNQADPAGGHAFDLLELYGGSKQSPCGQFPKVRSGKIGPASERFELSKGILKLT